MDERQNELGAVLAEVRRRWNRRARLGAWTIGAITAATMFGVGLFTVWLLASEGLALAFVVLVVTAFVLVTLASAARPPHHPPPICRLRATSKNKPAAWTMWSSPRCSMARPAARSREGWRGTPHAPWTASDWSA